VRYMAPMSGMLIVAIIALIFSGISSVGAAVE
jgi:hypothetical protein